jgi:hypothetical protein
VRGHPAQPAFSTPAGQCHLQLLAVEKSAIFFRIKCAHQAMLFSTIPRLFHAVSLPVYIFGHAWRNQLVFTAYLTPSLSERKFLVIGELYHASARSLLISLDGSLFVTADSMPGFPSLTPLVR